MTAGTAAPGIAPARLLELDPDLGAAMAPAAAAEARRHAIVPALSLPGGPFDMPALTARGLHTFGMLVTSGLVVRDVVVGQTVASELLGPGDVAAPDDEQPALVPMEVRWAVAEPATLALLDDRLLPALRAWPELARALLTRSARRASRVEAQRAISQLARVEDRLVALFGMLAERFARMTPTGLVISVSLTHAMLGRLVGARRPTVSLALKALADEGSVVRREDGSWLLAHRALEALREANAESPPSRAEAGLITLPAAPPVHVVRLTAAERRAVDERISRARLQTIAIRDRARASLARAAALCESAERSGDGRAEDA